MTRITMVVILRSLFSDALVRADEEDEENGAAAAVHVLGLIGMREMTWPASAPL